MLIFLVWHPLKMEHLLNYHQVESSCNYSIFESKGIKPVEIHRQLTEVYGQSCMDVKNVCKWCREFTAGHTEVQNKERSGRPSISDETVVKIEEIMREYWSITLDSLCTLIPQVS